MSRPPANNTGRPPLLLLYFLITILPGPETYNDCTNIYAIPSNAYYRRTPKMIPKKYLAFRTEWARCTTPYTTCTTYLVSGTHRTTYLVSDTHRITYLVSAPIHVAFSRTFCMYPRCRAIRTLPNACIGFCTVPLALNWLALRSSSQALNWFNGRREGLWS